MNNNWTKGCDFGFKVGQKAWHIFKGWGVINTNVDDATYLFVFISDDRSYRMAFMSDGCAWPQDISPTIFHVEQTFDYSSPKWQPEPGQLVWAWEEYDKMPVVRIFDSMDGLYYNCKYSEALKGHPFRYVSLFDSKLPDEFKHLEGGSK